MITYQSGVDERDDNVRVEFVIHPTLDGPDGVGITGQLGDGHLRHLEAVTKDAEGRPRTTTTYGVQLREKTGVKTRHQYERAVGVVANLGRVP